MIINPFLYNNTKMVECYFIGGVNENIVIARDGMDSITVTTNSNGITDNYTELEAGSYMLTGQTSGYTSYVVIEESGSYKVCPENSIFWYGNFVMGIETYGTVEGNYYYYRTTLSAGKNDTYTTKTPVDLTNYTKVSLKMEPFTTTTYSYFRNLIIDSAKDGASPGTSALTEYKQITLPSSGSVTLVELDISELTGEHYPGWCCGVLSSSTGNRIPSVYIYEWYFE